MKQCLLYKKPAWFLSFCFIISLVLFPVGIAAQDSAATVHGKVTSQTGEPLVGTVVMEAGTTNGEITNGEGRYSIRVRPGATLSFTHLGYATREVQVGQNHTIDVVMDENVTNLEEVIVMGFGSQKRRDVVGAVSQISGEIFEDRPNPSVVRSLQGEIPGLNITMRDGKPSRSAELKIRSDVNSIGSGGSSMVVIDGIEGDITTVNPDDIESITVLKDASSTAVYGSQGTFGVVLVTTKKPDIQKTTVKYSGSYSVLSRTVEPELVTNGYDYATSFKEAWYNYRGTNPTNFNNVFLSYIDGTFDDWYTELGRRNADPTLEKWRINSKGYYEYYGNTDWHDIIYRDHTWSSEHNLSVSGGNSKSDFYVSGRYFQQGGIYTEGNEDFKQYNIRAKGSVQITKWLKLTNNADIMRRSQHEPIVMYSNSSSNMSDIFPIQRQLEHQGYPMALEKNPDGTWTEASAYMGWAGFAEGTSYRQNDKFDLKNTTSLKINFIKDQLVADVDFSYYYNQTNREQVGNLYNGYVAPDTYVTHQVFSYLEQRTYNRERLTANAYLTYTSKFRNDNHSVKLMGGWNIDDYQYKSTLMNRQGVLIEDKINWDLLDGDVWNLKDNGSYSWGTYGMYYRANYSYKGKYLFEASGRYDAMSKFPANERWGFFPSFSAGWRLSEERFIKDAVGDVVDNIKIRGSAGMAGNGLLSNPYTYMSNMAVSKTSILIGGNTATQAGIPTMIPDNLTWEKAITYNLGLDVDLLRGRLNFVGDIYQKDVKDMYTNGEEKPAVAGYSAPKGNYADMRTRGWELSLAWRNTHKVAGKDFTYRIKAAIWDNKSTITRFTSTTNTLPTIYTSGVYYEGMTLGEIWGFSFDRFFKDAYDVSNSPSQTFFTNYNGAGNVWEAGDIKYKDLNKDGKIDRGNNTLDNHGDLEVIGNMTPRYHYSITLSANWNGIGLSMFWQGVGKRDWYPAKESSYFWGQYGRPYGYALPWHNSSNQAGMDENGSLINENAYWPRLRSYIAEVSLGTMSLPNDRYLQDASYIRLKTLTLDYTFPKKISDKLGMQTLKVYVTGENLLTFSPLKKWAKNFDPEVIQSGDTDYWSSLGSAGDGYSYPMLKGFTVGVSITF
jgi:TonB-linked SusC/RagA family outer membrane protein